MGRDFDKCNRKSNKHKKRDKHKTVFHGSLTSYWMTKHILSIHSRMLPLTPEILPCDLWGQSVTLTLNQGDATMKSDSCKIIILQGSLKILKQVKSWNTAMEFYWSEWPWTYSKLTIPHGLHTKSMWKNIPNLPLGCRDLGHTQSTATRPSEDTLWPWPCNKVTLLYTHQVNLQKHPKFTFWLRRYRT